MGYIRSPRGGGAPLLLPRHARLMAQQIFGATKGVSCKQMSLKGAYHATYTGFWEFLLIDANALSLEEWRAIRKPASQQDATVVVNVNRDEIVGFSSPYSSFPKSAVRSFYAGCRSYSIPLLELKDEKWCFAAIHAGLLPKGRTLEDALSVYDDKFAKSAHDSLAMRQLVAERRT